MRRAAPEQRRIDRFLQIGLPNLFRHLYRADRAAGFDSGAPARHNAAAIREGRGMADATTTAGDGGDLGATLGLVRVVSMTPEGRAVLEYRAGPHMCHSGGVVQGGFVTGWIDAAMAHAAIAMGGPDIVPMSLELKVSFFAPARPGIVVAEGWVERRGRSTCFFEGQLRDTTGRVLAKASSTLMLAERGRVERAAQAAGTPPAA
jgi:uncharacterized protein (TIGR00369 family)